MDPDKKKRDCRDLGYTEAGLCFRLFLHAPWRDLCVPAGDGYLWSCVCAADQSQHQWSHVEFFQLVSYLSGNLGRLFSELMQNLSPSSDRLSKFCTFKYWPFINPSQPPTEAAAAGSESKSWQDMSKLNIIPLKQLWDVQGHKTFKSSKWHFSTRCLPLERSDGS